MPSLRILTVAYLLLWSSSGLFECRETDSTHEGELGKTAKISSQNLNNDKISTNSTATPSETTTTAAQQETTQMTTDESTALKGKANIPPYIASSAEIVNFVKSRMARTARDKPTQTVVPVSSTTEGKIVLQNPAQTVNEMLVPENSTTALICEPIFNENSIEKSATWFKDGRPIATVTGHTNAIFGNRDIIFEGPIPQVGFLIITNIQIEDQGDYWCVRDDTRQKGDRSRLRVAFLHKFDANGAPLTYEIERDDGQNIDSITFKCPITDALPKPTISWFYEGEPVDFSSGRFRVEANALTVHRFTSADIGRYECQLFNFAGKTFANVTLQMEGEGGKIVEVQTKRQIDHRNVPRPSTAKSISFACMDYFRNEILWFLIGCLSTSCVVLLYLISGMLFFKCSKRGRRQRYHTTLPYGNPVTNAGAASTAEGRPPSIWGWLRHGVDPNLIPGFRKVVAPAAPRRRPPANVGALAAPRENGWQNLIGPLNNANNVGNDLRLRIEAENESLSDILNAHNDNSTNDDTIYKATTICAHSQSHLLQS